MLINRRTSDLGDTAKYPEGSILKVANYRTINGVEVADVTVNYYSVMGAKDEYFWFGSDYLGRDLFTRLFVGARISLLIAFLSVLINICIGLVYGSIAGYYGGKVDMVMMRVTEVIGSVPTSPSSRCSSFSFGTGLLSVILALVVQGWIHSARLIRAQFYRFKGREYVLAARTLGVGDRALIFRHILPNAIGPIITTAMISIPSAIFSEAFLAHIGLGIKAPMASIGVLLSDAQRTLLQLPYQTLFPSVLISLLMIAFNLFAANGLRDAFDPARRGEKLKEARKMAEQDLVLDVENLAVSFRAYGGIVRAVRGVSFNLKRGETVAIVGESGSGKSVCIKSVMGILPNNAIVESGSIRYGGMDLLTIGEEQVQHHPRQADRSHLSGPALGAQPDHENRQADHEVLRKRGGMTRDAAKARAGAHGRRGHPRAQAPV